MNIDPADIQLTPQQQAAIAQQAVLAGKPWEEVFEERFPLLEELTEEELAASLAICDRGMEDVKAGKTRPMNEAIQSIAENLGLNISE